MALSGIRLAIKLTAITALLILFIWAQYQGFSNTQYWWLIMVVIGLGSSVLAAGTPWFSTAVLGTALFIGASSQLALTQPLWFQSLHLQLNSVFQQLLLGTIILQLAVTAASLTKNNTLSDMGKRVRQFGALPLFFAILLVLIFATPVMNKINNLPYFFKQEFWAGLLFLLNLATVVAIGKSVATTQLAGPGIRSSGRMVFTTLSRFTPYLMALWVLIVTISLNVYAFERVPHVPDELAYIFQAKTFLLGRLSNPIPPPEILAAVNYEFLHTFDGKWFSIFPPGWPGLLTLGVWLNAAWLVNPILAALSILLAHRFFRLLISEKFAHIAVVLMASSPWFLTASASMMSHTFTIALVLASWLALLCARKNGGTTLVFLGGITMGVLFLTRPLDGLIVGLITGLWCLLMQDAKKWRFVLAYGLGCIFTGALLFPYNYVLTGDLFTTPIGNYFNDIWYVGSNRLGFAADIGPKELWGNIDLYPGHSIKEALIHIHQNFYTLNFDLFGWGVGSLFLAALHLAGGRKTRIDLFISSVLVAIIVAYSLYWFSGAFYIGPRYWFMLFIPMIYLSVRGVETLQERLRSVPEIDHATYRVYIGLAVLCLFATISFTSWRGVTKYHEFRGGHGDYRELLETGNFSDSLIFIKSKRKSDFGSTFIYNSPDLAGDGPLFVRDLGSTANRELARSFPDRTVYYAIGRGKSNRKVHLVAGPLEVSEMP